MSIPADWIEARQCMSILQPNLSIQIAIYNEWFAKNCTAGVTGPLAGLEPKRADLPPAP